MARPTKFDQTTADIIVKAVAAGLPNEMAAKLAGIDVRTLYLWRRKGKTGEEPFVQFFHDLMRQQAEAVAKAVETIRAAAERGEWRASAWWLERRHPDLYGSERKRLRELADEIKELARTVAALPRPARRPG